MKFKVGDWVKHIDSNNIYLVNGFSIHGQTKEWLQAPDEYHLIPSTECELWKPKEGEWCWYKHCLVKVLSIRDTSCQVSAPMFGEQWTGSIELEPFIGQLPTFVKDKQ